MPGRTDRPGTGPSDLPGQDDRPAQDVPVRAPRDELMRRLAKLPASHPSSPWYRERAAEPSRQRPGESRRAQPPEPGLAAAAAAGGDGPPASRRSRSGKSRVDPAPPADRERPVAAGGEAAAAARRAVPDGAKRGTEQDRRKADDALWQRAAAMYAASQARREARAKGTPVTPPGRRDPYRPWFASRMGSEGWVLSADDAASPWFTEGGYLDDGR